EREVGFAEEVLVTKTDMEEKAQVMLELKTRVEELKMENEYQLRLKDMNYSEKIKELTEKFIQEMESLKTKNQVCLRD
ncbi:CFAP57 isoform 3, partial [Pongo abelii]